MTMRMLLCGWTLALLLVEACTARPDGPPVADQRFVSRGPVARIEVLDWHGDGIPLVFLPGLGITAHVYEDFAPRFVDHYRVIAITPRGFGASVADSAGVTLDIVLDDIAAVLDTLKLGPVVLAGHSLGGDYATFFAARHPDRVRAVIYLDGANDRRPDAQPGPPASWPEPPAMTGKDSASDSARRDYLERNFGARLPLSDIRATTRFNHQGRYEGSLASDAVIGPLLGSLSPAPFDSVSAPALAIFPRPDSSQLDMPYWNRLTGPARAAADSLQRWLIQASKTNIDSVRAMVRDLEVVEIPHSGHLIFLLTPDDAEVAMRRFLVARVK